MSRDTDQIALTPPGPSLPEGERGASSRRPAGRRQGPNRQAIWAAIRTLGARGAPFTVTDIIGQLRGPCPYSRVWDYVKDLQRGGVLERHPDYAPEGPARWTPINYRLVADHGQEAPRVRRNGTLAPLDSAQQRVWTALRVLRSATLLELVATASSPDRPVNPASAQGYLGRLGRVGLVISERPRPGRPRVYALPRLRDTGPLAPRIRREPEAVDDPNTGRRLSPGGER